MKLFLALAVLLMQQPSTEKDLANRYVGKLLTLRQFYGGNNLNYDASGNFIDGGKIGNWPHDGNIHVESIRVSVDRAVLYGKRVYLLFDFEGKGFKQIITSEDVRLNFRRSAGVSIDSAIEGATIHGDGDLISALPGYWQKFMRRLIAGTLTPPRNDDVLDLKDISEHKTANMTNYSLPKAIGKLVEPAFPKNLARFRLTGTTVVGIIIDETGIAHVDDIIQARGMGLEEAAIDAISRWRFQPATIDGKPVKTSTKVVVNFRLS